MWGEWIDTLVLVLILEEILAFHLWPPFGVMLAVYTLYYVKRYILAIPDFLGYFYYKMILSDVPFLYWDDHVIFVSCVRPILLICVFWTIHTPWHEPSYSLRVSLAFNSSAIPPAQEWNLLDFSREFWNCIENFYAYIHLEKFSLC